MKVLFPISILPLNPKTINVPAIDEPEPILILDLSFCQFVILAEDPNTTLESKLAAFLKLWSFVSWDALAASLSMNL